MKTKPTRNIQIKNRKATHDYYILETWVAGISLEGSEVKSIREGHCNMVDSYCFFDQNELVMKNLEVPIGKTAWQHDPKRIKKLLLNRKELNRIQKSLDKGITLIPLRIFESGGWFKVEIGLAKGKKNYDKRETLKERDTKREIDRTLNT